MKSRIAWLVLLGVFMLCSVSSVALAEEVLLPFVGDYRESPMDVEQLEAMNTYAMNASQASDTDIVIALYDTVPDTAQAEAKRYLKDSNFTDDTVLLLVAEQSQDYTVYTTGQVSSYIDEDEKQALFAAYNTADSYENGIRGYVDAVKAALQNDTASADNSLPNTVQAPRLLDDDDVLSDQDEQALCERLDAVSTAQQLDVMIVTVPMTGDTDLQSYGEACFEEGQYGYAATRDGVMLLLYGDEWSLYFHGNAQSRLGGEAYEQAVSEQVSAYALQGDCLLAADVFIALTDSYLSGTVVTTPSGVPFGEETNTPSARVGLLVGIVVSAVAAVTVGVLLTVRVCKQRKDKN